MRNRLRRSPGRYRAVVYAALVHAAVIGALVIGFRWGAVPQPPASPMQAMVVEDPDAQRLEEEQRRRDEERRQAEAARERAERERKAAEERQRAEQQRQLDEQRRQEEERKAEAERKRQAEIKRKQEEERKRAEAELKRQEARKKEEEVRRKEAQESLKQQLEAEERARADAARAARAATDADKHKALIRDKVSRNWIRPLGAKSGLKCVVRVRLVPGGEVLEAVVVSGSGNAAFDRSVEAAVHKAAPLPLPSDPELFDYFREIEFLFNPEK